MNPSNLLAVLQLFSVCRCQVICDDDSKISLLFSYWLLLVGHGVVAIYIVVSNEHHCAFANIKLHLLLVGPIFKLFHLFLKLYYVHTK